MYLFNGSAEDPNTLGPSIQAQKALFSCFLASHTLHAAAIPLLYRTIYLSSHHVTQKLAVQLTRYPNLGPLIRELDLSAPEYRWQKGEAQKREDTASKLISFLPSLSNLEILRGPGFCIEALDSLVLGGVIEGCWTRLGALDWGAYVTDSMLETLEATPTHTNSLRRLKLRGGDGRLTPVVRKLLRVVPFIQHLDLSGTEIDTEVLLALPPSARLRSLNLKPCQASKTGLTKVMLERPEVLGDLECLRFDGLALERNYDKDPDELTALLSRLPPTLLSLDLSYNVVENSHISELRKLCGHLRELRIGAGLHIWELETLLLPHLNLRNNINLDQDNGMASKYLTPIADAVAICKLRQRINFTTPNAETHYKVPKIAYLDIRSMDIEEQRKLKMSVLLGDACPELRVVEFAEEMYLTDERMGKVFGAVGWRLVCRGGRCWIRRRCEGTGDSLGLLWS